MIRPPATVEDMREMAAMGADMHAEGDFAHLPYDVDQVTAYLQMLLKTERGWITRMEKDGKLIGFFCGRLGEYFFNKRKIATDFAFYVTPEWRGKTRDTLRCIEGFKDWAEARGAAEVCIGISTNVAADRTGELLKRLGFHHVGGTYKWRI